MRTPHPKTPALNKMLRVQQHSQRLGEFIEWLHNNRMVICKVDDLGYTSIKQIEPLLANYFKIDLNRAEKERRALLDWTRKQNEKEAYQKAKG